MSGAETPKLGATYNSPAPTPEYLATPSDTLKSKVRELSDLLEAARLPDVMNYSFTFHGETLDGMYIPEDVHKLIKQYGLIDEVTVECSYMEGTGTSFYIQFEMYDENTEESHFLDIERAYNYAQGAQDYDYVYTYDHSDAKTMANNIRPITPRDLNRCLASLICNDAEMNASALDAHNWRASDYEHLIAHLVDAASYHSSSHEYLLTDEASGTAGTYSYEEVNGEIVEFNLYRITVYNVDVSPMGNPGYYKKAIEASISEHDGKTEAYFREHTYMDDRYSGKTLTPSDADYRSAYDFIDIQSAQLRALAG